MAHFKGGAKEGQRAMQLLKQREKEKQEIEFQKKKLASELLVGEMSTKFAVHYDAIENQLKTDTVGLVTLDEMKARQQAFLTERERKIVLGKIGDGKIKDGLGSSKRMSARKGPISFDMDEDLGDDSDEPDTKIMATENNGVESDDTDADLSKEKNVQKRLGKNPLVDTSFLPDIYREEEEKQLREELRQEWVNKQASIKEEEITITYSYWDGSGHRRQLKMKKGHTIHLFLHKCVEQLRKEFPELKVASADQIMYVKEDLIIPHHYTFYDFIVTKARGKSGPLFSFDVYDDVRLRMDAQIDKEESHAGKVCLRSWYERHKHIFPASRWEPYDPTKNWDHYTVSDKMATRINIK